MCCRMPRHSRAYIRTPESLESVQVAPKTNNQHNRPMAHIGFRAESISNLSGSQTQVDQLRQGYARLRLFSRAEMQNTTLTQAPAHVKRQCYHAGKLV